MHVIILADYAIADGGAPKVAIDSARALAELGVSVSYIHAVGDKGDALLDHPGIKRISLDLADVWSQPIHKAAVAGVWNKTALARLNEVLANERRQDSVVHLHQWTKAFSPSVFAAVRASGLPLAVTMHDYFIACPIGVFYRFDTHQSCTLRPLSISCLTAPCDPRTSAHKIIRIARLLAQKKALRNHAFDVIHVSDLGARQVAPYLGAEVRQHRVDNPVAIAQRPQAVLTESGKMLYLGRFTVEKGAVIAAEAAKKAGMPALFVGEGPAQEQIRAVNPEAEIRGWVKPSEVARLLSEEVRVLVAPSRWPETGPLTIYEAMASGIPVLGSTMSGAAEKIIDGETGLIAAPTVEAQTQALQKFRDIDFSRRLGAAAYQHYWKAPPTPENHAKAVLRVYEQMLAG